MENIESFKYFECAQLQSFKEDATSDEVIRTASITLHIC